MSLASMTELAMQRRSDIGSPHHVPKTYRQIAAATAGKEAPANAVDTALKLVVTYIPTEVITLYLAIVASLQPPHGSGRFFAAGVAQIVDTRTPGAVFWGFLAFTPIATWLIYAARAKGAHKKVPLAPRAWPVWEMVAGTLAFAAWAIALPEQPFSWIRSSIAAVIVLGTSTILGLAAPLFSKQIKP